MSENAAVVTELLAAYGNAMRMNWAEIDGRTVRDDMGFIGSLLEDAADPITYHAACVVVGVCPVERCWVDDCTDRATSWSCIHTDPPAEPHDKETT